MRFQFIHLPGEFQWPPFRAFESASNCVDLRLFQLTTVGLRFSRLSLAYPLEPWMSWLTSENIRGVALVGRVR